MSLWRFWPFGKKENVVTPLNETHIIFNVNKSGETRVIVAPRACDDSDDEDQAGAELCLLYQAIVGGKLAPGIIAEVETSNFTHRIQKKIVRSIGKAADNEVYIDPRAVFPDA